jgi:hypothetical protein
MGCTLHAHSERSLFDDLLVLRKGASRTSEMTWRWAPDDDAAASFANEL